MFFIFSKLLLFLLSPLFWIILFLAGSLYTKAAGRKKVLRRTAIILAVVFTNPFLFNVLVRMWQPPPTALPAGKTYSAAILLGGIVMNDKDQQYYFGEDADRFIQATKLFHSGVVKNIVVSGGSAAIFRKEKPEADQLNDALLSQGIPQQNIIIENRSRNTFENARFVKQKLDSMSLPGPYILVTSAMHVPRAKAVFEKNGLAVIAYPAAYKQINNDKNITDYIIPSIEVLSSWDRFLKEVVGLAVYRLTGKA